MSADARPYDGVPAALPLAAAFALLLARWIPVEFDYRPNDLGIVSLATQQGYALQQETFWALFAGAAGALLAWTFARALARGGLPAKAIVGVELLGAAALAAALWLTPPLALLACTAAAAGAWLLVARLASGQRPAPLADVTWPPPPCRGRLALALGVVAAFGLGLLLAPGVWENLWSVAHRVPDERLVVDNFKFLGEAGQHLAWANALRNGGFQGRDVFCLYGPLYDLGVVGLWKLVGRSIAGWELYWSLTRVCGWAALLLLGAALLRRPALVLLLPFLLPWVKLRVGLALFGLLFLLLWMRSGKARWSLLAGASGAGAVLFSQEFGLAFLAIAGLGLSIRLDGRGALLFAVGLVAVSTPLLGYYAANDALAPMLRDLVQYPRYLMAGYAKLPFPALTSSLPLDPLAPGSRESLALRLGYSMPAVCVGAALLLLPVSALDPRRPLGSLRAVRAALARHPERLALLLVALFGIFAFRSALGRSQLSRTLAVLPPAVLLLTCALDRALDLWRGGPGLRTLAAWRVAALAALVFYAGFPETGTPIALIRTSLGDLATLHSRGHHPRGDVQVMRVTRWIQLHTESGEPVLFLPNDAAYYYLTDRPSPIRFVLGHQMVTETHRAEALAALRASPPRYVVWDDGALRVDGLADELVFGRALLDWIEQSYEPEAQLGEVRVLSLRGAAQPESP